MSEVLIPSFAGYGGKFALPRAYIRGVGIDYPSGGTIVPLTRGIEIQLGAAWGFAKRHIQLTPQFWAWSSNHYTVDHIFDEAWDAFDGGSHLTPPPYIVGLKPRPGQLYQYLHFIAGGFDADYWFELPPSPTGYWTPNI